MTDEQGLCLCYFYNMTEKARITLSLLFFLTTSACGELGQGITVRQRDADHFFWDAGQANPEAGSADLRASDARSASDHLTALDATAPDNAQADTTIADSARPDTTLGRDAAWSSPEGGSPATCDDVNCSGHGTCIPHGSEVVCACAAGFSPGDTLGLSCVPTSEVCPGGALAQPYDIDNDGTDETTFYPTDDEKRMYELVNYTRATHDMEDAPECFRPLAYDLTWSAHGRNHSYLMQAQGGLFHADFPFGQNCAWGAGPEREINMYMTGANEPHCPQSSHHCNIMQCRYGAIGVGTVGTWNTQNFF